MRRVPPVVVGAVELAEHLLGAVGGQVGQSGQLRAGVGAVAALLGRPQGATTLMPGELALLQCQIPHRTPGMPPAGQPVRLSQGRVGTIPPARMRLHGGQTSAAAGNLCPLSGRTAQWQLLVPESWKEPPGAGRKRQL
jgi:hypothetical protein